MNDLKQLHSRFLEECPDLSDERWQTLMAQLEELGWLVSTAALEKLLEELSSLKEKASARGDPPEAGLLDLPTILAWRLSVYFRDAAVAMEKERRPESMEAGWDEQMDQYREFWGDDGLD